MEDTSEWGSSLILEGFLDFVYFYFFYFLEGDLESLSLLLDLDLSDLRDLSDLESFFFLLLESEPIFEFMNIQNYIRIVIKQSIYLLLFISLFILHQLLIVPVYYWYWQQDSCSWTYHSHQIRKYWYQTDYHSSSCCCYWNILIQHIQNLMIWVAAYHHAIVLYLFSDISRGFLGHFKPKPSYIQFYLEKNAQLAITNKVYTRECKGSVTKVSKSRGGDIQ